MTIPELKRKETYIEAVSELLDRLRRMDRKETADRAGASLADGILRLRILGREASIHIDEGTLTWSDGKDLSSDMKVVVLNYLLSSKGRVEGNWVSYREIPSGSLYYSVFHARGLSPLVSVFGTDTAPFEKAAETLGGKRVQRGDASYDMLFFPFLPVNATVWRGDEEVPASANILFDSLTGSTMPAEVLAHLAEELTSRLIETASR